MTFLVRRPYEYYMRRVTAILVTATLLSMATLELRASIRLFPSSESPVVTGAERVPVLEITPLALVAGNPSMAFWVDPRMGHVVFKAENPTASEFVSGEPFAPFSGLRVSSLRVARMGSGYLMIAYATDTKPPRLEPSVFYALPLSEEGIPLRPRPEKIWDPRAEAKSLRLVTNGQTALLSWLGNGSLRTLELSGSGDLLEFSAPAEEFAGKITRFDIVKVGSSYLLVVNADPTESRQILFSIALSASGQRLAPSTPILQSGNYFQLAEGTDSAMIIWFDNGQVNGALLSKDGSIGQHVALIGKEREPSPFITSLVAHRNGWTLAWTSEKIDPSTLQVLRIAPNGSPSGLRTVPFDRPISRIAIDRGSGTLFSISVHQEIGSIEATWFLELDEEKPIKRTLVSSLAAQRAEALESSWNSTLAVWSDYRIGESGRGTLGAKFLNREAAIALSPIGLNLPPSVTSDGLRFLLLQKKPEPLGETLVGRFIDDAGTVSQPFIVAEKVFNQPISAWSGTEFLAYWSEYAQYKLSRLDGPMRVTSISQSGTAHSRPVAPASTTPQDVLCTDNGCFVIWNYLDMSSICDFCLVRTALRGSFARVSGDLVGQTLDLANSRRPAQLARAGANIALIEIAPEGGLRVRILDWNGTELSNTSLAANPASSNFSSTAFPDGVVVVWEQTGDIFGKVVSSVGVAGPSFPIATSEHAETNPKATTLGDRVTVMYERLTPGAGWVPRVYVRDLTASPSVRQRGARP